MKSRLLLLVAFGLCTIGCKKGHDLVGTWTGISTSALGTNPQEVTYEKNGSFRVVTTIIKDGKGLVTTDTGKWKLDGDQINYTFEDSNWEARGVDAATSARIQQRYNSEKAKVIADMNAIGPVTIRWIDDNKIVEVTPQGETTYTRKQ